MQAPGAPVNSFPVNNVFSVDVEEWYHFNYPSAQLGKEILSSDERVVRNVNDLLGICAEHGAQATFFFLGSIAEQFPQLVRQAQAEGHEIASHGYGHNLVYQQTRGEFYDDVKRSIDILQDITGQAVKGYRAPSWSISQSTPWAYEILLELGLQYDSSLFPFRTFLYGDGSAPVAPFTHFINGSKLYEVPATVLKIFGVRVPFGGGFYLRFFPYWMTYAATHLVNRQGRSVFFYLHPREIDPMQPRLKLSSRDYYISYVNLTGTLKKLRKILSMAPTISIYRYLQSNGFIEDDST